jgi:hypothetical protein
MGSRWLIPMVTKVAFHGTGEVLEQFGQPVTLDGPAVALHIRGGFVLVNEQDVPLLFQRRWNVRPHRRTAYCIYRGRAESLQLHRVISPQWHMVDHINRAGWDNRRTNLREADTTRNSWNHAPSRGKAFSQFKGVSYDPKKRLYRARIMVNRKSIGLGRFKSEEDAARAYDAASQSYHGEFGYTNDC